MRSLWADAAIEPRREIDDNGLAEIYAYPSRLTEPWIQANFVSSADGGVTADGHSEGLSSPADKRVFALGRLLCDVILVGAGTARAEQYEAVSLPAKDIAYREAQGLAPLPRIAVVTQSCDFHPDSGLFATPPAQSTLVITCESASQTRRSALTDAGAEIIIAGKEDVDVGTAVEAFNARGLLRVNCEGGPHLFGQLVAKDLVDQLCLTVAPLCVGAGPARLAEGARFTTTRQMTLASVLNEDGFLMLRYRRGPRYAQPYVDLR